MTPFQRVIKYLAIALAIFIIFSIISAITELGAGIFGFLSNKTNTAIVDTLEINDSITDLKIDLKYTNLSIKKSDVFKLETSNKSINTEVKDGKLIIKDNSKKKFISKTKETVILSIPDNMIDNVYIKNEAGDINIDSLTTNDLTLELGLGKTNINYLEALKSKIDTGVGKLTINDGILNNSTIDIGVGEAFIKSIFTGDNTIENGIGKTTLELIGNEDDYQIKINKGIGSINYNNKSISNNSTIGSGNNTINIDGGIGSIIIKTLTINSDF